MTIILWDMDDEYKVETDVNSEGKDFVRISVLEGNEDVELHLNKEQCLELSRTLAFIANEIKD